MRRMRRALATTLLGAAAAATGALAPDIAPAQPAPCQAAACGGELVYFGSRRFGTPAPGVKAAWFDRATGALTLIGQVADIPRATWVTGDPTRGMLYVVDEFDNDGKSPSELHAFRADRTTGTLRPVSRTLSGGRGPTNLFLSKRFGVLFAAHYNSGEVSALPVKQGGALAPVSSVATDYGTGPLPRQTAPHAHGVALDPSGRVLITPDLGADRIFVYRFDRAGRKLTAAQPAFIETGAGTGPRHVVIHPNGRWVFVNTEFNGGLNVYRLDAAAGTLTLHNSMGTHTPDYAGTRSSGEIGLSPEGRFLYVTNRGEDTIAVYSLDVANGALTEIQRIASGGRNPWSFCFDATRRWLLVANMGSDQVDVFARDPVSGRLTATDHRAAMPAPSSIAFVGR